MRNRNLLAITLTAVCAVFSGCAHHVGYTDVNIEYAPVENPKTRERTVGPFLAVTSAPTAANPNVGIRLYEENIVEREAVLEHSGIAVRVPYHWSVPIVKPILPVTAVLAVWMPARAPHDHRHSGWHAGDYLRDFAGWLNPFEGFPAGAREMRGEHKVFRKARGYEVIRRASAPVAHEIVHVYMDGVRVSYITINERGEGSLNLRTALTITPPDEQVALKLKGAGAESRIVVGPEILRPPAD